MHPHYYISPFFTQLPFPIQKYNTPMLHISRYHRNTALCSASRAACKMPVRFLSSKKSDSKPEAPHSAAPPKKQALSKLKQEDKPLAKDEAAHSLGATRPNTSSVFSPKRSSQNYIAFKDLPKPSKELQDMSSEQFHALLHMTNIPEKGLPKHDELMPLVGFKYDFTLQAKHRLPIRRSPLCVGSREPSGAIEPNLALLGITVDTDTLSSGMEAHPLRESITGMCVMNPLMKEIRNKSLWEFFPESKKYGSSPFGRDASFNAFKDWEDLKNAKLKSFEAKKQEEEKEFRDFCKNLHELNSFVRKLTRQKSKKPKQDLAQKPVKSTTSETTPVETSGRRKLDRGLLKQYRKYMNEQYSKDSKDDKEDE